MSRAFFWTAGKAESLNVVAVRPDGQRVAGVKVQGTIVRREWHQVRREAERLRRARRRMGVGYRRAVRA